jgi:hypothetical protein
MYLTQTDPGARSGAAVMVITVHIAVIYAVAVSLGVVEAPAIVEPMDAVLIEAPRVEPEPILPKRGPTSGALVSTSRFRICRRLRRRSRRRQWSFRTPRELT